MSILNLVIQRTNDFQITYDVSIFPIPLGTLAGRTCIIVAADAAFLPVSGRIVMQLASTIGFDKSRVFLLRLVGRFSADFQPVERRAFQVISRASVFAARIGVACSAPLTSEQCR